MATATYQLTDEEQHREDLETEREILQKIAELQRDEIAATQETLAYQVLTSELNIARTSHLLTPDDTAALLVDALAGTVGWNPEADTRPHFGFMYRGDDGIWRRVQHYQDIGPTHIDPAMASLVEYVNGEAFTRAVNGATCFPRNAQALAATAQSLKHRASHYKRTLLSAKNALRVGHTERRAHFAMWLLNYGRDADLVDFRNDYRADGYAGGLLDREVNPLLAKAGATFRDTEGRGVSPSSATAHLQRWIDEYQQSK